jgi:tetratricopeptide (TPR) repeat protein
MLPPKPMLVTKNRIFQGAILFLLAFFIAGCSPAGTRALLKGKKFLERGDYDDAVAQLKNATSLLITNAAAWNYYGVALQHAGQPADAVAAYERALALNRDLTEAHYNLGCLWLEQNKPDAAKTEFVAYALRRNNAPEGWLKLGSAQLRSGETIPAEKSFSTALSLNTSNAEAFNGLGLARVQRGRPQEAIKFFAAAIQLHPDYAPAILNLATVEEEFLRDNKAALENYRKYLALAPRPANWDAVNALAENLERPVEVSSAAQNKMVVPAPTQTVETKTQATVAVHTPPARPAVARTNSVPPVRTNPPQVAKVQPATTFGMVVSSSDKPSVMQRLNATRPRSMPLEKYIDSGVTPLPPPESENDRVASNPAVSNSNPVAPKPVEIAGPAPPVFPRYAYLSPRKPAAGNRRTATGAFEKARDFEQNSHWRDAMESYQQASKLDPAWFEAQYNLGVLAYRLRNFPQSLAAYEMALAIQPDSIDTRYNFALALKAAGYPVDAVNELKKITTENPDEVRAQLALGNLYAQQFRDSAQAREHYLKVLQLDPRNPQATDIHYWLLQNPS